MAICTAKSGTAMTGRRKLRKRIMPAEMDARELGRPTMECIHPKMKP
jgi:hypothetical protein